ncbi:isopeptide-forming domain-containing fimbrial protein [Desulfatibacillum aliphaticivorans]|uniref:isopeptide-forming domain-containing fimbrial protein n=1 Tax=Desulfatibacillum aliphaticivorans TaxID=218208 RepID=UPI0003F51FB0|nr:isopeptide-forming domain-containing fimbrial protein [Desulfatibacillum aliphaticivorans]
MKNFRILAFLCLIAACLVWAGPGYAALTPAGTVISNQAHADYKDANGNSLPRVFATPVTTLVGQVAAVDLSPPTSTKSKAKGTTVNFGAEIVNTGNGQDAYTLAVATCPGWTAVIYLDDNENGIRDAGEDTEVTATAALDPNENYWVVVQVTSPAGASNGDACDTDLTATSQFDGTVYDMGTFTYVVQDAELTVNKTVSPSGGVDPGTVLTYAIEGSNTGTATAENVIVTDPIPANTTYVANSIRVGPSGGTYGTATPQTDLADNGQVGGDTADYNISNPGKVTVFWGDAPAGDSGIIYFQVTVNANVQAGVHIENTADIDYEVGGVSQPTDNSTKAQNTVDSQPDVSITTDQSLSGDPSDEMVYPIEVCNYGNSADVIDLTVQSSQGWTWTLWLDLDLDGMVEDDGDYILTDTDGDGKVDTGSLAVGACRTILALVTIPAGSADQSQDTTLITVASSVDPTVTDSVTLITTVTAPVLNITKTVNPTGTQNPGTVLVYTITATNTGTGAATEVSVTDQIPTYTTFVAGSIHTGSTVASLAARSDAIDGDGAGYSQGVNSVVAPDGGTLSLGQNGQWIVRFSVTID